MNPNKHAGPPPVVRIEGIPLRDLFAMAALVGWMANPSIADAAPEEMAECCYRNADAMLAARKEGR